MSFTIILQRKKEYPQVAWQDKKPEDATIGELIVDKDGSIIFKCVTCENGGESTDTPNQDKRIVAREYNLSWTESTTNGATAKAYPEWKAPSGKNVALWLKTEALPSFANRRILIHSGNAAQHTEGCILLGYTDNGNGTISNSSACVNDFFKLVKAHGVEKFKLIVKEIE